MLIFLGPFQTFDKAWLNWKWNIGMQIAIRWNLKFRQIILEGKGEEESDNYLEIQNEFEDSKLMRLHNARKYLNFVKNIQILKNTHNQAI